MKYGMVVAALTLLVSCRPAQATTRHWFRARERPPLRNSRLPAARRRRRRARTNITSGRRRRRTRAALGCSRHPVAPLVAPVPALPPGPGDSGPAVPVGLPIGAVGCVLVPLVVLPLVVLPLVVLPGAVLPVPARCCCMHESLSKPIMFSHRLRPPTAPGGVTGEGETIGPCDGVTAGVCDGVTAGVCDGGHRGRLGRGDLRENGSGNGQEGRGAEGLQHGIPFIRNG